jgi:uncharacterized protein YbjT (DUF2867 family)
MTILVTGATGTVGKQVLHALAGQGATVRALTRSPEKARLPESVTPVAGDLADVDSLRNAMNGVSTVFVIVGNATDELNKAMMTVNLARDAKMKGLVYLSVFKSHHYPDVPHFASKVIIEKLIESCNVPATILQPCYFYQNDAQQKDGLLKHGVYSMPIGHAGLSMVDTRDIGEAAAKELLRRERSGTPLPRKTYELVGPDALTGPSLAALWGQQLGRSVAYGGDDLEGFEKRFRAFIPATRVYDIVMMMRRYQNEGAVATKAEINELTQLLGHAPRSYSEFAKEMAAAWQSS